MSTRSREAFLLLTALGAAALVCIYDTRTRRVGSGTTCSARAQHSGIVTSRLAESVARTANRGVLEFYSRGSLRRGRRMCIRAEGDEFESSFAREVARRQGKSADKSEERDAADMIRDAVRSTPAPPSPPPRKAAPKPPPFAQLKKAPAPPPFERVSPGERAAMKKQEKGFFSEAKKWLNFDFTDPDWGKSSRGSSMEGDGSILERGAELAKLGLGFAASFWPLSAVAAFVFASIYFGFGSSFVHGGYTSSNNVPKVTPEEVLRDL